MAFFLLLLLAPAVTFEESFRAGLLALQRNDLASAQSNLATAAKLAPGNGRVWVALAQTYRKLQQAEKADLAAGKAETLGAADPVVLSTLAIYYTESGQLLKAADAEAKYHTLAPNDSAARDKAESLYFQAVQPLLQQQKFSEAIPILTRARERIAGSAQLELALGVAYYGLRRFDEAAAAFLRTIAIAPDTEQPYLFLGRFLGQIPDKLPEVTARFVRFETAHPESAAGYLLHAKALNARSIEPETARTLLEKAISLDPRDASSHFELGLLLDDAHKFAEAAGEFEKAAELDPADPAPHYRLARIYDRLGKPDAAQAERARHAKLVDAQQNAKP